MLIRSLGLILLVLVLMFSGTAASAQQPLFRSDLPLFTQADELWPRSFWDDEGFGCSSIIHFGDYVSRADNEFDQDVWWRFVNYGVFHCALIFSDASERDWLNQADHSYAWLVPLGDVISPEGEPLELFALQIGTRGGSEYLFLARPVEQGVNEWRVLDAECPRGAMRETDALDIWGTAYCAIDSARTLRAMARTAGRRPSAYTFAWVGRAPDIEAFLPAEIESFARRVRECRDLAQSEHASEDNRRWAEEAAVDYGCAELTHEGPSLSTRYDDRPEIAALISALLEQGPFVRHAPAPVSLTQEEAPSSPR